MDDAHNVIAAFLDGEPVDSDQLSRSLATVDGRDYLVDVLLLRGMIASDGTPRQFDTKRGVHAGAVRLAIAVSLLVGLVSGTYFIGHWSTAATNHSSSTDSADLRAAPEPTRVVALEDNADWLELVMEN